MDNTLPTIMLDGQTPFSYGMLINNPAHALNDSLAPVLQYAHLVHVVKRLQGFDIGFGKFRDHSRTKYLVQV